ncbi:MAG: hypothetical protein M1832_002712 [Thelocarpon impressellum]|nr:MAG: hypothetical protein M1832_002712 [Thelocarpon impressellum]
MSQPLSPLSSAELNLKSPPTIQRHGRYEIETVSKHTTFSADGETLGHELFQDEETDGPPSSPFVANPSPVKDRSPTRQQQSPLRLSPKKPSPTKGRMSSDVEEPAPRMDEGLTRAVELLEDDESVIFHDAEEARDASMIGDESGYPGMDESAFSTFSAIPNADMTTMFARSRIGDPLGSPTKQLRMEYQSRYREEETPKRRGGDGRGPADSPAASPTPRRARRPGSRGDDTTNLLDDFTEQIEAFQVSSSSHHGSPSRQSPMRPPQAMQPGRRSSPGKRLDPTSTPSARRGFNLIDMDITPAPTPRSLPSISARELESLKSGFLSQISSLKASLSGREAEVNSLKEAVGDAERRVGEAQEEVREQRDARESLEADREGWEKRSKEMETVVRGAKDEILRRGREKDELAEKLEASERKREEAEMKAAEAESRAAGMQAGSATAPDASGGSTAQVSNAVEKVARELHALYRSKHEAKVAALRRSYEARWEKRTKELEKKVEDVSKENEELRLGTMSGVLPSATTLPLPSTPSPEAKRRAASSAAEAAQRLEEQRAKAAGLAQEMASVRLTNEQLTRQLEQERCEKGDLVAAVEEMLAISVAANASSADHSASASAASSGLENLRGSISRASGVRPPGFSSSAGSAAAAGAGAGGESRIGRIDVGHKMSRSGSNSALSGAGGAGLRSGIMGNIERMGRGRGGE